MHPSPYLHFLTPQTPELLGTKELVADIKC